MYLIVGLGNPERKYENTKHNIGFDAVGFLTDRFNILSFGTSMKAEYGKGLIAGKKVMTVKPLTYMNLSGDAVRAYIDYYNFDIGRDLIVVYDDVDLDIGEIRIRKKGSAGSHNGMRHIIRMLGSGDFTRVRIGIGPKPERWELADYVLSPFSKEDRKIIDGVLEKIPSVIETIMESGIDDAMTKYNRKKLAEVRDV